MLLVILDHTYLKYRKRLCWNVCLIELNMCIFSFYRKSTIKDLLIDPHITIFSMKIIICICINRGPKFLICINIFICLMLPINWYHSLIFANHYIYGTSSYSPFLFYRPLWRAFPLNANARLYKLIHIYPY